MHRGAAELSRKDAKRGKKDRQITQITQISGCDCLSLGPKNRGFVSDLLSVWRTPPLTVICVICGSYPLPFNSPND